MKLSSNIRGLCAIVAAALFCGVIAQQPVLARQGATDPIPGTSNGGTSTGGGGGGGKGGSTTPAPAPAPQPVVSASLTFTPLVSYDGMVPQCTGSYQIDPYYPTLSLMTVTVQTSSVNIPDGSYLYITVNGTGGTMYPFTSNIIPIVSQNGSCSYSEYVTPGTVLTSVVISDMNGVVVFTGQ